MTMKIMVQGTMSNSGKSFLAAALCRIFRQDGYRTAPFKSQNMALNSYITEEGLEIGRAQAMQAEAAKIPPSVDMNPILLKPTSQMGSQVIVNGEVFGNLKAMDYYRRKTEFIPAVRQAFKRLSGQYDVIVLEGAGSPAEINLRENDIVNMGMAEMADAPVILVGDIDRGGVFASLYGTVSLLEPQERARIKGLVINKFRGDVAILEPGLRMIGELLHIPVVGVIPMEDIDLDDEDSLAERLNGSGASAGTDVSAGAGASAGADASAGTGTSADTLQMLDIAVIRLPHISNFTDFAVLERRAGVRLRYVEKAAQLKKPDLVILPGTKNTMADLSWLRACGLEPAICRLVEEARVPVIGICGGYQMLGTLLRDPEGAEGEPGSSMRGMGLLDVETTFAGRKTRTQICGRLARGSRMFAGYDGGELRGYEIHMGRTAPAKKADACARASVCLEDGRMDGAERSDGLVFGSYLHGLFDNVELTETLLARLAGEKGIRLGDAGETPEEYRERQYDKLADLVRRSLDMERIYAILRQSAGTKDGSRTENRAENRTEKLPQNQEWIKPEEIENRSMELIGREMPGGAWTPGELLVVKRCIHTSADFDYAENLYFSPGAVECALDLLRRGGFTVVTDTNMGAAGINKAALRKLGGTVRCFMAEEQVAEEAKARGVTRALVSMEHAARLEGPVLFAIGNAPTALIRIYEMIRSGEMNPAFVIGTPVGFVNVAESKELICRAGVPCIVARGRKGGSNIAAAICNALFYQLTR